jgi:hypothetical protein
MRIAKNNHNKHPERFFLTRDIYLFIIFQHFSDNDYVKISGSKHP